jgi:hypothetical protein
LYRFDNVDLSRPGSTGLELTVACTTVGAVDFGGETRVRVDVDKVIGYLVGGPGRAVMIFRVHGDRDVDLEVPKVVVCGDGGSSFYCGDYSVKDGAMNTHYYMGADVGDVARLLVSSFIAQ